MSVLKFPPALPRPSRADGTRLPAVLAALLLALLPVQLILPTTVSLPEPEAVRALRITPPLVAPVVVDPVLESRPLFAPSRRLAGNGAAVSPADKFAGARAVGIFTVRGLARVFIQAADGRIYPVNIGGSIGGWHLDGVDAQVARFSRADQHVTLAIGASALPVRAAANAETQPEEEEQ